MFSSSLPVFFFSHKCRGNFCNVDVDYDYNYDNDMPITVTKKSMKNFQSWIFAGCARQVLELQFSKIFSGFDCSKKLLFCNNIYTYL